MAKNEKQNGQQMVTAQATPKKHQFIGEIMVRTAGLEPAA